MEQNQMTNTSATQGHVDPNLTQRQQRGMFANAVNLAQLQSNNSLSFGSVTHTFSALPEGWSTMFNVQKCQPQGGNLTHPEAWNTVNSASSQLNMLDPTNTSVNSIRTFLEAMSIQKRATAASTYKSLPMEWTLPPATPTAPLPAVSHATQTTMYNDKEVQTSFPSAHLQPQQTADQTNLRGLKRANGEAVENNTTPRANQDNKIHRAESNDVRTQFQAQRADSMPNPTPASCYDRSISVKQELKQDNGTSTGFMQRTHSNPSSAANNASNLTAGIPSNVRWNSWSHEEEVFLVVSVLDRFFRRGSLASASKGGNDKDCWSDIQKMYNTICASWHALPENKVKPHLISRTTSALCRHFKIMKVRAAEGDANGTKDGNFRRYLREWESDFNKNGRLIQEEY